MQAENYAAQQPGRSGEDPSSFGPRLCSTRALRSSAGGPRFAEPGEPPSRSRSPHERCLGVRSPGVCHPNARAWLQDKETYMTLLGHFSCHGLRPIFVILPLVAGLASCSNSDSVGALGHGGSGGSVMNTGGGSGTGPVGASGASMATGGRPATVARLRAAARLAAVAPAQADKGAPMPPLTSGRTFRSRQTRTTWRHCAPRPAGSWTLGCVVAAWVISPIHARLARAVVRRLAVTRWPSAPVRATVASRLTSVAARLEVMVQ